MTSPTPLDPVIEAHQLPLWQAATLAFVAMCAQDLLATLMVIFEAHYQAVLAGTLDTVGYLASLACSVLALDSILKDGWRNRRSLTIIAAVSVANFAGTGTAVAIAAAGARH